jgi:hypothetical protein
MTLRAITFSQPPKGQWLSAPERNLSGARHTLTN